MATLYLLDTNLLLAYMRADGLYRLLEKRYSLWTATPAPIISVVSEGEIRALAEEFAWGGGKRRLMEDVLARFTSVPLPFASTIDAYVRVSDHTRSAGRVMGKNDLWIAATAIATGATLLTTDKVFDPLHPTPLTREWIDSALS